jgi:hypothetical protein
MLEYKIFIYNEEILTFELFTFIINYITYMTEEIFQKYQLQPFMLPSDDEIFLYNENEKQRKFHVKS